MISILKTSAIFVFGIIIGYYIAPDADNDKLISQLSTENIPSEKSIQRVYSTVKADVENKSNKNQILKADSIEIINDVDQLSQLTQDDESLISEHISNDDEIEYSNTEEELNDWTIKHKSELDKIIDENMPNSIIPNMKSSIANDNRLLNDPIVQQESIKDDRWAYLMEQDIRDYIALHELAAGFNLLHVSCKQLICDVVGIEFEANTWRQMYRGFYSFPNVRFPSDDKKPRNVSRLVDGSTYIYAQIMFNLTTNN